jgi:hypothetical protein
MLPRPCFAKTNTHVTVNVGKSNPKFWAPLCKSKKLSKENSRPTGQKFAPSDHPGLRVLIVAKTFFISLTKIELAPDTFLHFLFYF